MRRNLVLSALALGLLAHGAAARIKLAALPERERVEIQLDNGRATLVEEERIVPLLKGGNQVDFSWSNAAVNKDSIQFRPIGAIISFAMSIHRQEVGPLRIAHWGAAAEAAGN